MNRQRELLKKSFDALIINRDAFIECGEYDYDHVSILKFDANDELIAEIKSEIAKPEQEPIGYVSKWVIRDLQRRTAVDCVIFRDKNDHAEFPIYEAPTQYELSDDEIWSIFDKFCGSGNYSEWLEYARAIEKRITEGKK